jgi:hypothetical protein
MYRVRPCFHPLRSPYSQQCGCSLCVIMFLKTSHNSRQSHGSQNTDSGWWVFADHECEVHRILTVDGWYLLTVNARFTEY